MEAKEKEFIIPKNVSAEFEIVENIRLKDIPFFIPSILISVPMVIWTPIHPVAKIFISGALFIIPFILVRLRPIRDNIPAWKHVYWKIKFADRQTKFYYRKEEYDHVIQEEAKQGAEAAGISSKPNTVKGNRFRLTFNTRQSTDSNIKG